ncbi:uncharacterized protein BP5553_09574 [Venustampulla echinocandica]|uniref:Aminoglycoside phosphotransferase domain-containing protein n=1 Tax=Venustampulla echinocandica TaxID=2656787 RepID=A0A370TBE2_9HELO|nr:uncharacterized protein BP5553_09574 [Venustampulla echinocandica]RDL31365.1 hypothetical protein BP5553_09574 [Venustampulla echinocandica]
MKCDKQFFDDVAYERSDVALEETEKSFRRISTCRELSSLMERYLGNRSNLRRRLIKGSYNVIYKFTVEDRGAEGRGEEIILRIPFPGVVQFPDEKTLMETATMLYVSEKTSIPTPPVYYYGLSIENPTGIGPFIIMGYVENDGAFSQALDDPEHLGKDGPPALDPNVPEEKLEFLYGQMAGYLLQLSKLKFPRIGSLLPSSNGHGLPSVEGRPISLNMNSLIQLANVPPIVLPAKGKTYITADEWYLALAEMQMAHLVFQHNDLTYSDYDCRNKYVARQLFRRLAKEGKLSTFGFADDDWSAQSSRFSSNPDSSTNRGPGLSSAPDTRGPFHLWCDDLRGGNILVDKDLRVAALIDWEFAYVGPAQFALDPPWWLLLEEPECWPGGIQEWSKIYDQRLETWLRCVEMAEEEEAERAKPSGGTEEMVRRSEQMALEDEGVGSGRRELVRLSTSMRESWQTGRFWLNYAARKSWAFDSIYWKVLDERFFGDRGDIPEYIWWQTRLDLLTDEERQAMDPFVERKMKEYKAGRILVDWDPEEAKEVLAQVLV